MCSNMPVQWSARWSVRLNSTHNTLCVVGICKVTVCKSLHLGNVYLRSKYQGNLTKASLQPFFSARRAVPCSWRSKDACQASSIYGHSVRHDLHIHAISCLHNIIKERRYLERFQRHTKDHRSRTRNVNCHIATRRGQG